MLQPTAPDPYGSQLVIATASVRSQFGTKLATVYAPEVIASFGTGANRIDVRLVAPNGPAAFGRALRADLLARKTSGAELLRNRKIVTSAVARAQLAAGQVDLRLLTTLAFMAGQEPLDIVDFGSVAPGAGPGVPLRFADLAETDPATRMTAAAYRAPCSPLVHAQQPPYVPLSVGPVRLTTGQTVLRMEFAAPSLLGCCRPDQPAPWLATRPLLDPGRDRRRQLDCPADRAQPVVRLPDSLRQDGARLVAVGTRRERDPVGNLHIGQVVAVLIAHLVGVDRDLERVRLSPARGQDVDVDRRAATQRDQQQLGRSELLVAPGAERDPAAAGIDRGEAAGRNAFDGETSVHRFSRHTHTMPDGEHGAAVPSAAAADRGWLTLDDVRVR